MDREPLVLDASGDELVEMAACAAALAYAHEREFGDEGQGVTRLFARCSERLRAIADSDDRRLHVTNGLTGDSDESVLEASKRLREVYELELERAAADPWCLVLERLLAAIDDEVARRPEAGDLPVM
ncbi:MAG TPA: hypothetical protein VLT32_05490 [Candidatus Sulfomarinibacteraceae bacterium]|nr:hypothetical protein [Candidatus Sulfomarinibacteraceae bacterium]